MNKNMTFKILLAGDGGQGIQLIADAISEGVFLKNWFVTSVSNYGLEQRGGVSLNFVIISDRPIGYPKFKKPDVLLLMSEQARERTIDHRSKVTKILDYKKYQEKKLKKFRLFYKNNYLLLFTIGVFFLTCLGLGLL